MLHILRVALIWVLKPLFWLFLKLVAVEDAWERLNYQAAVSRYGAGAKNDFGWYFEGASRVTVASVEEVKSWLLDCTYVYDPELVGEVDHWQHPVAFETLRKGDCEDHAIWAWRKLVELGVDADLVAGRLVTGNRGEDDDERGHVWVVFRAEGTTYLFETVEKKRERMVRALADVKSRYRPEFGVDRHRKRFTYNGVLLSLQEKHFGA